MGNFGTGEILILFIFLLIPLITTYAIGYLRAKSKYIAKGNLINDTTYIHKSNNCKTMNFHLNTCLSTLIAIFLLSVFILTCCAGFSVSEYLILQICIIFPIILILIGYKIGNRKTKEEIK